MNNLWRIGADVPAGFRSEILRRFPPKFPQVFCQKVTWAYGVGKDFCFPTLNMPCSVYGYHETEQTQAVALAVEIEGWQEVCRPDGKLLFITLSADTNVPPFKAGEWMNGDDIEQVVPEITGWIQFQRYPLTHKQLRAFA